MNVDTCDKCFHLKINCTCSDRLMTNDERLFFEENPAIKCKVIWCYFNINGFCRLSFVEINVDKYCDDYEKGAEEILKATNDSKPLKIDKNEIWAMEWLLKKGMEITKSDKKFEIYERVLKGLRDL